MDATYLGRAVVVFACLSWTCGCATTAQHTATTGEIQRDTHQEIPGTATATNTSPQKPSAFSSLSKSVILGNDPITSTESEKTSKNPEAIDEDKQAYVDEAKRLCGVSQECWQKGDVDSALKILDEAYLLILKIDDPLEASNGDLIFRQKEDLRFAISKRILEIYAARNTGTKGQHDDIPIDMNHHVRAEIDSFISGNFFKNAYIRSGKYHDLIVKEFEKAGIPVSLAWLPLIESGFQVDALSPARALGLWQFIPSTGYKFGLKRDQYIDERMDPYKSTLAAIAYLKELHQLFGDWSTVLAAYNCGEGKVLQVIRSQNVNYLDNFWDLYEKLPRETARYVPQFLATLHILKYPEKYGIDRLNRDDPLIYETLSVEKQVGVSEIAKVIGTPTDILKDLNPELKIGVLPRTPYELKIPPGKKEILTAMIDQLPSYSLPRAVSKETITYHRVKKGESIGSIANRYRVNVRDIITVNHLQKKGHVVAGKIIKIPQKSENSASDGSFVAAQKKPGRSAEKSTMHVVKRGDSIWNIAEKYGMTTEELRTVNNLGKKQLAIGQKLKIPYTPPPVKAEKADEPVRTYHVQDGDVPQEIAKRHNMSLDRLLQVNNLNRASVIYPGQKLHVE